MPFVKENENDFGSQYGEYRYDAFGFEDPLEKYVVDRSEFFYRNWDWALAQAELEFHFLANRLGENDVRFSSENSELVVDSRKTIDDNCQDLVTEKFSREYFGCTSQESWHGNTLSPYLKPLSTTYLAKDWTLGSVLGAQQHELSHQAITTLRQLFSKDHQARKYLKLPSLSDSGYAAFERRLEKMDRELDVLDRAWENPWTKKIEMEKKSDVWSELNTMISSYYYLIKEGF